MKAPVIYFVDADDVTLYQGPRKADAATALFNAITFNDVGGCVFTIGTRSVTVERGAARRAQNIRARFSMPGEPNP